MELRAWSNMSVAAKEAKALGSWREEIDLSVLSCVYGAGRSYSDVALPAPGSRALLTRAMDKLISFDPNAGTLRAEAGASLSEILDVIAPRGWTLPVAPGTGRATLGGAIGNDVHGKNQASAGSFGASVASLLISRSDSGAREISRETEPELFAATIGGLGATGLILAATLRLRKISSEWMRCSQRRFSSLAGFFEIDQELRSRHEYTVAWLDCLSAAGRGVYFSADHDASALAGPPRGSGRKLAIPLTPPLTMVNGLSVRALNEAYWASHPDREGLLQERSSFFFPLDGIENWNRMYGPKGFFQYQCLIPNEAASEALGRILTLCAERKEGSFLAVLKTFGPRNSPAELCFAREGVSFAMDFANKGAKTLALLAEFDAIVQDAGGALYPAKDGRMSAELFKSSFPQWERWWAMRDPAMTGSLFLRRVMGVDGK